MSSSRKLFMYIAKYIHPLMSVLNVAKAVALICIFLAFYNEHKLPEK